MKSRLLCAWTFLAILALLTPLLSPGVAALAHQASELGQASSSKASLSPVLYQENDPAVALTGSWTTVSDSRALGGAYVTTSAYGDTAKFSFTGDSLVLYHGVGLGFGSVEVMVDGTQYGAINFSFLEPRFQVPAIIDHLGNGTHNLKLTVAAGWGWDEPGTTVSIDAFGVPSGYAAPGAHLLALSRVNSFRRIAGVPVVAGATGLEQAAQSHAEFFANNHGDSRLVGLGAHLEYPDLPGYTGRGPGDRGAYFGYAFKPPAPPTNSSTYSVGEDMHFIGDPISSVDGWMETVYHRNLIMTYGLTDLGYGMVRDNRGRVDVLDMGISGPDLRPPQRLIYTYPGNGEGGIPSSWWGGEIPDPLPGKPKPVGFPISLYIAQPAGIGLRPSSRPLFPELGTQPDQSPLWETTTAELRDSNGQVVPTYLLDPNTDPWLYDTVFLIPQKPLTLSTTYTAHVAGSDRQGVAFDKTWSFITEASTTGPTFPVTVSSNRPSGGEVSPSSGFYGANSRFTARPAPGYAFLNWTINGVTGNTSNPLTLNVTGPTTLVANFTNQLTDAVYLPVILDDAYGGWNTGISIRNPSAGIALVEIVYYDDKGTVVATDLQAISANGSWGVYQGGRLGGNWAGSATILIVV